MNDVIEQARKLADMIAGHDRTRAFHDAIKAVEADPEARRIQRDYATAMDELHRREAEGRPIEPEQKRAAAASADAVRRSPPLLRLLETQAAYAEMLEAVQHVLSGGGEEHEHGPGCEHGHEHGPAGGDKGPEPEAPPRDRGPILWTP